MKQLLVSLLLTVFFSFAAQADEQGARNFAESTANSAVAVLASNASDSAKMAELEGLFVDSVDTNWIGRFVLGRHWRNLDDSSQKEYLNSYKDFLVKHYTQNFKEYSEGTKFEITHSNEIKKNQYRVSMSINRPTNAQPVKVDYRVRQNGNNYSIIDIVVEGVSLLNTQRSEFSSVIQRKGVDHLIEQLKAKS